MPGFYAPQLVADSTVVLLSGDEFHHLCHVFRRRAGDEVVLTSGTGITALGIIRQINKRDVVIEVQKTRVYDEAHPPMACAFALLRNKHDAMIIEKCTELGVRDFFPFVSDYTVRKPSANTIEKFCTTAIAAIKQCDNAFLPRIHPVQPLASCLDAMQEQGYTPAVAVESGQHPHLGCAVPEPAAVCMVIGPEGGFSTEEKALFVQKKLLTLTLGNHILRAETAAITSISQLLHMNLMHNSAYY